MADILADDADLVPRSKFLKWAAYAAGVTALMACATGLWGLTGSDNPPLASIDRVNRVAAVAKAQNDKTDAKMNALITTVAGQTTTILTVQRQGCQRDREAASADLALHPGSASAQEALDEANDCVKSLTRSINR